MDKEDHDDVVLYLGWFTCCIEPWLLDAPVAETSRTGIVSILHTSRKLSGML